MFYDLYQLKKYAICVFPQAKIEIWLKALYRQEFRYLYNQEFRHLYNLE
ncbi:hypothetical protein DDI_1588 [Dickeya dianthicola RNS04.9]|nr:hypothetical protein DDI_1588 [Dickeya dianthicola RNS04.9]